MSKGRISDLLSLGQGDIRIILALRELITAAGIEHLTYAKASGLLKRLDIGASPNRIERVLKEDVKARWSLHLPQVFRPRTGRDRSRAGFDVRPFPWRAATPTGSNVSEEARGELRDMVKELGHVEFPRFLAILFDRMGYYVHNWGAVSAHGHDLLVAEFQDEAVRNIVVEAKSKDSAEKTTVIRAAARQARKYFKDAQATRGIVALNRTFDEKSYGDDVEVWDLRRIVNEMVAHGLGIDGGRLDKSFVRDIHMYFRLS